MKLKTTKDREAYARLILARMEAKGKVIPQKLKEAVVEIIVKK